MQVSNEELLRISEYVEAYSGEESNLMTLRGVNDWVRIGGRDDVRTNGATLQTDVQRVVKLVNAEPEVREEIVASLRARIESGSYFVDGESIAEMMMRRSLADRLR